MLDLPWFSVWPFLISLWAIIKFEFFFFIGIFLIVPTNLVILVRNLFPGRWRYRPFFLRQVYYVLLWFWRGEAPTVPYFLVRPLLGVFTTGHFERRLRRLRREVALRDDLSDDMRSKILTRLDAALEQWKAPRFATVFFSVIIPVIFGLPGWFKQFSDFVGSFGSQLPTEEVASFVFQSVSSSTLRILALSSFGYLLILPITAFLAKRGLFLSAPNDRICFPGGQEGAGIYAKEREILDRLGIHVKEVPVDLWILGIAVGINLLFLKVLVRDWLTLIAKFQSTLDENNLLITTVIEVVLFLGLAVFVGIRRQINGRA